MTIPPSDHHRFRGFLLSLVIGSLGTACFNDEAPSFTGETDTSGSSSGATDAVTDGADDTHDGSTSSPAETGTTGPDGCPPAVFDASRFDEACFQ